MLKIKRKHNEHAIVITTKERKNERTKTQENELAQFYTHELQVNSDSIVKLAHK